MTTSPQSQTRNYGAWFYRNYRGSYFE